MRITSCLLLFIFLSSCVDYSEVPVPAYLYIDKISLNTSQQQGSSAHGFKDAWVYVNDEYYGAYEIPFIVPISKTGQAKVKLYAGIRSNGVTSMAARYPMTAPYEIDLNLVPKKIDTLSPIVKYYDYNIFAFNENFDRVHFFNQDIDQDKLTQITLTNAQETFEGQNSGEILLTAQNPIMGAQYDNSKPIPAGPNSVYLELNYKNDVSFSVGLIGYSAGRNPNNLVLGTVKPRNTWGKIYFDFTDVIKQNHEDQFRIAVTAQYDTAITADKQYIRIDNFKLIYQ